MSRRGAVVQLAAISVDHAAEAPLYRQIYDALRGAILSGRLRPGARLPSTRDLAAELAVSRNTVTNAFEQLLAEGYLEGKVGAGTYVSHTLPDDLLLARAARDRERIGGAGAAVGRAPASQGVDDVDSAGVPGGRPAHPAHPARLLSRRGMTLATTQIAFPRSQGTPRAFRAGVPALDVFPSEVWGRLVARQWRRPLSELLAYGEPAGYRPLRRAIATYLAAARAVRCTADQVIVIAGAQQGLDLAARLLIDPGEAVLVEDPGYIGTRGALLGAGARVIPVPVDGEGLDIEMGERRCPEARLVYVTPSHQYPLGVTMSLPRRLALLGWAHRTGGWVLEDDYDSEYRYAGRPVASLQGLDAPATPDLGAPLSHSAPLAPVAPVASSAPPGASESRVIYLGTFSKVLFPSLRLGYLVVPPDLVDAFTAAHSLASRHPPSLEQAVLADFIGDGHFATHLRRMRALYAGRRDALLEALRARLGGLAEPGPSEAGMQLVAHLPPGVDDADAARRALAHGVETAPLSRYALETQPAGGLLLGYACVTAEEIQAGVRGLEAALLAATPASHGQGAPAPARMQHASLSRHTSRTS